MILKLLNLIETHTTYDLTKERYLLNNLLFSISLENFDSLIQFQLTGDAVLVASKPLKPVCTSNTKQFELPNIFPIKPTVTLNVQHFYDLSDTYREYIKFLLFKIM